MRVIHKFKLAVDGSPTTLKLKNGYKIVHSEYVLVDKAVCIWVEQSLSVSTPEREVVFEVAKSGDPIHDDLVHVASAVDSLTPEAYHIFKKSEPDICGLTLDYYPHAEHDLDQKRA
ncbi:MAG: hypothetical protein R3183_03905 [Oleiphilaceae bacterium]|nr:hypothetical protein [Oleiphilaceae bacterium]